MAYEYETMKSFLFSDEGQRAFLQVRDRAIALCGESGAFTLGSAVRGVQGSQFEMLACIDRLVELGEFCFVSQSGPETSWILTRA